MSDSLWDLYARLGLDTTDFQKGVDGAVSKSKTGAGGISDAFKQITGVSLESAGTIAGVATAVVSVIKAVVDSTKETAAYAAEVRDLNRITGQGSIETSRMIQTADDLTISYATLEAAARGASQKGIAFTTDSLAKLSDQYLAIKDPAERAKMLLDDFGRSGLEMGKYLVLGGAAIKNLAAEQGKGLLLTQAQVDAARQFEIVNDNLNDTFTALKYTIGNQVMPVANDFLHWLNSVINAGEINNRKLADSSTSYEDYIAKVKASATATGGLSQAQAGAVAAAHAMSKGEYEAATATVDFANDFTREMLRAQNAAGTFASETAASFDTVKSAMLMFSMTTDAKKGINDTQQSIVSLTAQIKQLSTLKVLTPQQNAQIETYWEAMQRAKKGTEEFANMTKTELTKSVDELQGKIWNLMGGSYLTPDQKAQLETLNGELSTAKTKLEEQQKAFEQAAHGMAFNMLETKAASDGLTTTEVANLTRIAVSWGLMDNATATTVNNLNGINLDEANMKLGTLDSILGSITGMPHDQGFNFNVNYTSSGSAFGQGGLAPTAEQIAAAQAAANQATTDLWVDKAKGSNALGGSWEIPSVYGYEGYPVGPGKTASAGEIVTVTPAGKSGPGGDNAEVVRLLAALNAKPSLDEYKLAKLVTSGVLVAVGMGG